MHFVGHPPDVPAIANQGVITFGPVESGCPTDRTRDPPPPGGGGGEEGSGFGRFCRLTHKAGGKGWGQGFGARVGARVRTRVRGKGRGKGWGHC